jgi:uncharacterized protein
VTPPTATTPSSGVGSGRPAPDPGARTLYVDTSALVRRYLHDRHRPMVLEAMADADAWCASALARTEAQVALHRASVTPRQQRLLWSALRDEWEAFWVVPLDDRGLAWAVEIGAAYGVRIVDAIHLAAADRLPGPVRYLTFDRQQIPAAAALGFEVLSPVAP